MSPLGHDLGHSNLQVVSGDASCKNISNNSCFYLGQTLTQSSFISPKLSGLLELSKTQEKKILALTELAGGT